MDPHNKIDTTSLECKVVESNIKIIASIQKVEDKYSLTGIEIFHLNINIYTYIPVSDSPSNYFVKDDADLITNFLNKLECLYATEESQYGVRIIISPRFDYEVVSKLRELPGGSSHPNSAGGTHSIFLIHPDYIKYPAAQCPDYIANLKQFQTDYLAVFAAQVATDAAQEDTEAAQEDTEAASELGHMVAYYEDSIN